MQSFVGRCCPCPLHLAIEVKILQNICMRNFSHNSKGDLFPLPPILSSAPSSTASHFFYFYLDSCCCCCWLCAAPAAPASLSSLSARCQLGVYWFSPLHEHFFDTYSTLDRVQGREAERGTGRGAEGQRERHSNGNRTMCANTNFNARPKKHTKINCKAIAWRKSMIYKWHTLLI